MAAPKLACRSMLQTRGRLHKSIPSVLQVHKDPVCMPSLQRAVLSTVSSSTIDAAVCQ